MGNLIGNIEEAKHLPPDLGGKLQEIRRLGVSGFSRKDPKRSEGKGPPVWEEKSGEISRVLRKEVSAGRMFICSSRTVGGDPEIMSPPPTLAQNACRVAQYQKKGGRSQKWEK